MAIFGAELQDATNHHVTRLVPNEVPTAAVALEQADLIVEKRCLHRRQRIDARTTSGPSIVFFSVPHEFVAKIDDDLANLASFDEGIQDAAEENQANEDQESRHNLLNGRIVNSVQNDCHAPHPCPFTRLYIVSQGVARAWCR